MNRMDYSFFFKNYNYYIPPNYFNILNLKSIVNYALGPLILVAKGWCKKGFASASVGEGRTG